MSHIDTRDLIDELRAMVGDEDHPAAEMIAELEDFETERVQVLQDLIDDVGRRAQDGVTLIPESEFEEYARELAEDIGAISGDGEWPGTCIDWTKAARELRMDYTTVEFEGTTYLYRA